MPPKKKGKGGWGGRVSQERDYECCNHVKLKNSTQKIFCVIYLFIIGFCSAIGFTRFQFFAMRLYLFP